MFTRNSHRHVAWLIFLVIAGAYLLMAVKFPRAYIVATYEDLVGEWAQVFLFAITMLLAVRQAIISARFRLFFGLLAFACLYVVGEEISWGQRIFDIQTPEFFNEHNLQQETNLHNLLTGPISTVMKQTLEYAIAAALIGYGLGYPWMLRLRMRAALWLENKGLAAPPLYLSPFFILGGFFELGLFNFNEAEIAEILIPFALAVMTLGYTLSCRQQIDIHTQSSWERSHSTRLACQTVLLFVCVVSLSFGTTLACYASPRLGAEMHNRYLNGVEKFAGRYKRFEQWDLAAGLYRQIQREEPNRASVRRNLFRCYEQLGQLEEAQLQIDKAIEIDLERLATKPYSVSANISMVRNYQIVGNVQKAQQYLQQALAVGLSKKVDDPQNPNTAYWLGTSYTLQGDYVSAYQEFQTAVRLRPDSLRFKKALLKASRLLPEEKEAV